MTESRTLSMARADVPRGERDQAPMQLPNLVDCEVCDTTFDVVYIAQEGVYDMEDLVDAPVMLVQCPACGHAWEREWEGWLAHEDAGHVALEVMWLVVLVAGVAYLVVKGHWLFMLSCFALGTLIGMRRWYNSENQRAWEEK